MALKQVTTGGGSKLIAGAKSMIDFKFTTTTAMNAAIQAGTVPEGAICLVEEDTPYVVTAGDVSFDNTGTNLTSITVQAAIVELNNKINQLSS